MREATVAQYASMTYIYARPDDPTFVQSHKPGELAPFSGIYRCHYCGLEVTSEERQRLPRQNSHLHAGGILPIEWRLLVKATHERHR